MLTEKKFTFRMLASTGSAAHPLKMDTEYNVYIQNHTREALAIADTDVIIVDEYSMLTSTTLDILDASCQKFNGLDTPFGGKHVVHVAILRSYPQLMSSIQFSAIQKC